MRVCVRRAQLVIMAAVVLSGCDSAIVRAAPRPAGLWSGSGSGTPGTGHAPAARSGGWRDHKRGPGPIELIDEFSRGQRESEELKSRARVQAGLGQGPTSDQRWRERRPLQDRQADLVREATARDPLALVVEVTDPADRDLAQAIGEAQQRGTARGSGRTRALAGTKFTARLQSPDRADDDPGRCPRRSRPRLAISG